VGYTKEDKKKESKRRQKTEMRDIG